MSISEEAQRKQLKAYITRRIKNLPEGLKPGNRSREAARQVPAMDKIARILLAPRSFEPIPPMLHYGYPIDVKKFCDIAVKTGFTKKRHGENYSEEVAIWHTCCYISQQIGSECEIRIGFCSGTNVLLLSLCDNYEPCRKIDEILPKVQEILGVTEQPKWYLNHEHWRWRR
ncbi:hypothetical protein OBBRIDRAFT_826565 [Obba rivulosa]|uniref:Uncharacterized protein n=1 Tax=Obba rivulosa TaxID=1052685 RepID=A0A8E2AS86_9APHY|nr:hypothetical protein OBBRIDRAFT_826565 [Obba rivulosa]